MVNKNTEAWVKQDTLSMLIFNSTDYLGKEPHYLQNMFLDDLHYTFCMGHIHLRHHCEVEDQFFIVVY